MRFFVVVLSMFSLMLFALGDAQAQKVTEQFKKAMPKVELMPEAEFKEGTEVFKQDYPDDPALNFEMRIPKGWTDNTKGNFSNIEVRDKVMGELRKFYGPPSLSERSRLVIEAAGLDFDMTAEHWFIQYLLENGYNLQGLRAINNDKAEAAYVFIENGFSYVVRAMAVINGKRILFAQYFVPVERWHEEKALATGILNSFNVTKPVEVFVEEMEEYQFLDLATFKYPTSWNLRALPVRSIDRMRVELNNVSEIEDDYGKKYVSLDGQIDIELVSIFASEKLEDEIDRFRSELSKRGMTLGEVIESRDDFLLGDKFDFVDTQVYRVTNEQSHLLEHELWMTIMSAGEYYYFVTLFTPSRDKDYFMWARNAEAYKLVVSLINPEGGGLVP